MDCLKTVAEIETTEFTNYNGKITYYLKVITVYGEPTIINIGKGTYDKLRSQQDQSLQIS